MASVKKIDDEIRLNILSALTQKRSVIPNIRQIQKYTGYHKATVKSSLDFLLQENVLTGFGPKVNFRKFDYKLEALVLSQADFTKKETFEKYLKEAEKDQHLYRLGAIVASGNWNIIARHIYKDIESFHKGIQEKYYHIPGIYDFLKDRQAFFSTEPFFKNASRTDSIISIIRKDKGLE